ncbi:MAG: DUF2100 domain-containing protein [Methanobacterium sp.]|nr:MAG: DUF2100 domain-containing protein [Methanobacterium sp.]
MDNIRTKQAENLIKLAGKTSQGTEILKNPKKGFIDVKAYERALKDLIAAEDFIYTSLPSHGLSAQEAGDFTNKLLDARENIHTILADFGVIEKISSQNQVHELSKKWIILTTKSNYKKMLMKMGVNVQQIVVAGVPLKAEDMKQLNPKIPDAALKSIDKKITHVKNDISRKMEKLKLKNILVIAESDLNGDILGKNASELYGARVVLEGNLKDLNDSKLVDILLELEN